MHSQLHPDTEQLDRLRAGLLDDSPRDKDELEAHIARCDTCRARSAGWDQLGRGALGPGIDGDALARDLRLARLHALANGHGQRQRHVYTSWATAALLLIAVMVGVWTGQSWLQPQPQVTAEAAHEVPDIYEDLDFYLWLADQKETETETHSDNPNST
jgi:anti-sigma factor RsiW